VSTHYVLSCFHTSSFWR